MLDGSYLLVREALLGDGDVAQVVADGLFGAPVPHAALGGVRPSQQRVPHSHILQPYVLSLVSCCPPILAESQNQYRTN